MDKTPRTGTEPTQPTQPTQAAQPTQPAVGWSPPPPARRNGGFDFSDFISFRYLITPGFITVIYVIGAIFITIAAFATLASPTGRGGSGLVGAIVVFVIGQLWWRILLEFVMVLFRINDSLTSIDRRGRGM